MSENQSESDAAFWKYWHAERRIVVDPNVRDSESDNHWRVGQREDWPNANKPYFLYGGPGGVYSRHNDAAAGEDGQPIWFKREVLAQRKADEFNAALNGLATPVRHMASRPATSVRSEARVDKPVLVCDVHFVEHAASGECPLC